MGKTIFSGAFFRLLSVDPFAGRSEIDDVSHTLILTLSGYACAVGYPICQLRPDDGKPETNHPVYTMPA